MTVNQKNIKELNGFRHFSKILDEFDNLGITGNNTKDLRQIKRELENFKGNHSNERYALLSSGIASTTAIMITLFCLALFFCIRKHLNSKKNRKIIERMNASAKNDPE